MPIATEEARTKLQKLVDDFELHHEEYKKQSEADIETKLVEELFINVLGWSKSDFTKQAKTYRGEKRGEADYAFHINDKTVFFLEVKKVGISLNKEADRQVISYALSNRVPFAISTNFEQLKIFCAEQENAINNVFRIFRNPDEYLENLHDLLFLSKESFEQGTTLKKAEDEGRLRKRISIDKPLLEDLMHIRELISNNIENTYPKKYEPNEKDEIIQRILDRLIFIRKCEDTGINPDNLQLEEIRHVSNSRAYSTLKEMFKRYDDVYNAGLFAIGVDNDCDKITINGEIIKKLVSHLYESENQQYIYNFDWIDADVLGQVYEQYLGKILKQFKSGRTKLRNGQAHRKEQGIYYTPTYVVDYIVKNTIGEVLKNKKIKVKDITILDPACGSGSFLIKAFDYLYKELVTDDESKQHKFDSQGMYSFKTQILKNNIYGVDLDNKAVEITKLNLLLKAAEKGRRLPEELDLHIRRGNSLIDDENVAGLDAFKWEEKFKQIMDEGGFDVVIGNPPYVRPHNIAEEDKKYFWKHLKTFRAKSDLYSCFMEKSIDLSKDGGLFSFIVPITWTSLESFFDIRKYIVDNCKIVKLTQLPKKVFQDSTVETCVFVLSKESNDEKRNNNKIKVESINEKREIKEVKTFIQSKIKENHLYNFELYSEERGRGILNKIKDEKVELKNLVEFFYGLKTGDDEKFISKTRKNKDYKKLLRSQNIDRYSKKFEEEYVWYVPELMKKNKKTARPGTYERFETQKIVVARMGKEIVATLDDEKYYIKDGMLLLKKDTDLEYILGILNSKLINYFYKNYFITVDVLKNALLALPVKVADDRTVKQVVNLVDKMLSLNRRLNEIGDKKTDERVRIEEELKKTDAEIDEVVYGIYGITEEEKKVIEESLK